MTNNAAVSDDLAQKFVAEKDSPYLRWVRSEGLDIFSAHYVANLNEVPLKPWARRGAHGAFLNHDASRTSNDCYICRIEPGKSTTPQRQLFEEMILILEGQGATSVWNDAGQRQTFEWQKGAIMGIPLNCWHQHFNLSGRMPVRFVAVTNAPVVINLYEDPAFVFRTEHDFKNRFSGEPNYFGGAKRYEWTIETNFIPDALNLPLPTAEVRGAGGGHIRFSLARASMAGHISQFPTGTYKKAHAHGPGAHVIILSGEGYTLTWQDGLEREPSRYDWHPGTLIVPPNAIYHQHFNTGRDPARYLAFRHGGSPRNSQGVLLCFISRRLGGDQLDYADERDAVREMFAAELHKHGMASKMEEFYVKERQTLPELVS
jgi:oxalate decarboxylase/phosphoglucose isomerase-like protein (cupin superfamily)